ncbi:MAG: DUF3352 domain-containing protein [Acaryochloridaceae cyanobacterium SU_2_1]|nr:DUF3352 domain-containing protein [Acaryochloridaceae cyanobacterium SU_2_1]
MVKLRSILFRLLATGLALCLVGGAAWALEPDISATTPSGATPAAPDLAPAANIPLQRAEIPSTVQFAPRSTPVMISWMGNPNQWQKLLPPAPTMTGSSSALAELPRRLLATADIDYQGIFVPGSMTN